MIQKLRAQGSRFSGVKPAMRTNFSESSRWAPKSAVQS